MKKIAGKIAMILVLVILANSFISCFSYGAIRNGKPGFLLLTIPLDILTLLFQAIGTAIGMDVFKMGDDMFSYGEMEPQIYLANVEYNTLKEYHSLRDKIYSLPNAYLSSLKQTLKSIPETERVSTMEKISSLNEEKIVSMIRNYNSLPENEIISSIERLKTLSNAELVSLLRSFNSLSESELDSLIAEVKSLAEKENVALMENLSPFSNSEYVVNVGYSREKVYSTLCFYY